MRALAGIMLIGLGLNGCFEMPVISKGKVSTLDEAPRLASTLSSTESKSISAYDPTSKVATTIAAPSGNLSGSAVTLPVGALGIAADLVMEEAVPLNETSVTGSLSISSDISIKPVGSGLIIRPTTDVDLTKPLTISMPINPTAGLNTWLSGLLATSSSKYYTVFYKYFYNGELKAGAIATSDLRFGSDGSVIFEGYFGAYWLAEVSAPIQEKLEVKTEEPIVNRDKVSVIASTGVITEETIVAKASIPTVDWKSITLTLTAEGTGRSVTATATISEARTLNNCSVDLFERTDANSGINILTGAALKVTYTIAKQEAHTLYARFRCLDDQQRLTISGWSLAVTVAAVVVPVATATVEKPSDFCGTSAREIRLYVGAAPASTSAGGTVNTQITLVAATSGLSNLKAFTYLGNCVYTLELDTLGDFLFGIQTADFKTTCSNAAAVLGDQTLNCVASNGAPTGINLGQGNYVFTLDFSASATSPKLNIALQPCALGDLYLLRGDSSGNYPTPVATNRMQHLGGCQYTLQIDKGAYGTGRVRIQNLSGTYGCGNESTLQSNSVTALSCGASNTYYNQYFGSGNIIGYKYTVNLGTNLDRYGQSTAAPYLYFQEIDTCMSNIYMLGSTTSAGSSRIPGVNSFRKGAYCAFNFSWINNGAGLTPFYIGFGEGTQRCGMPAGYTPTSNTPLDCTAAAVPIDLQSAITADAPHNLSLTLDYSSGLPNYATVNTINPICGDAYYAVRDGTIGFFPKNAQALTEVKECLYQYEWTPTPGNHGLMFMRGNYPNYRCGLYPGYINPTVGGPATDLACLQDMSLATDYPVSPNGIVDGTAYRVTLDLRLDTYGNAKVSVAPLAASSCPDLHVLGLAGYTSTPDSGNKMLRTGGCNYVFNFHTPTTGYSNTLRIKDTASSFTCGRDIYAAYAYPEVNGRTTVMDCAGTPSDLYLNIYPNYDYQLQVHYESSGTSTVSVTQLTPSCNVSQLDGPGGNAQNSSFGKVFTTVGSCVEELLWVPTAANVAFRLKHDFTYYQSYCGLDQGQAQLSLSGVERNAICNIFNVANTNNFAAIEGIAANQKYLIHVDRKNQAFAPPKISVAPVSSYFEPTAAWMAGSYQHSVTNTTSYPGGRRFAATWTNPTTQMKYMYGGLGFDENGSPGYLADLWQFNGTTWTLLPSANFGVINGNNYSPGNFHASNRPSARMNAVAVFDPTDNGKLWLFGGFGRDSNGQDVELNDLWVYDLGLNQWAMMSGNNVNGNNPGTFAGWGVPAHGNYPGSRHNAVGWIDSSSRIYIFGGWGYADTSVGGALGRLNDLWIFDPMAGYATNTWTFAGGDPNIDAWGTSSWPSSRLGAAVWKDATGKVWLFGGNGLSTNYMDGPTSGMLSDLWSYDTGTNTFTRRGGPDYNDARGALGLKNIGSQRVWPGGRYFSSTWTAADGSLWMFGGEGFGGPSTAYGRLSETWRLDPTTLQWTWLPSQTQSLGAGEVSWEDRPGDFGTMGVPGAAYHPAARSGAAVWPDSSGNVWIFGGYGFASSGNPGDMQDLWYLDF